MSGNSFKFEKTSLAGALFSDVNLRSSKFDDVNLADASFSNVSLAGATFDDVNLSNAAITHANIEGMTINGALVSGLLRASGEKMPISTAIAQLRTTDLAASIRFYTVQVGLILEFQYEGFYAGIRAGGQVFHLKLVDEKDPSIDYVDEGGHFHLYLETDDATATADALKKNGIALVKDVHDTPWGTREFVIKDDQGHTLYFGENRKDAGNQE